MATRSETSAATREALLTVASALLDSGGPDAVTLREVGARAGVSKSAPYRHFADKESLLTVLATRRWSEVGDDLAALASDPDATAEQKLRQTLLGLITIGRTRPRLYPLMFSTPVGDPTAAVRAAGRAQDYFLDIVAGVVGPDHATQYGGLLLTSAHGIIGLELSGHLSRDKWHATAEDLIELLIGLLPPMT